LATIFEQGQRNSHRTSGSNQTFNQLAWPALSRSPRCSRRGTIDGLSFEVRAAGRGNPSTIRVFHRNVAYNGMRAKLRKLCIRIESHDGAPDFIREHAGPL
jgi:hypothetical protein